MPDPKATRKAPSGVRTSSPVTNVIAAFAVTASCTRRQYANTLLMSTTRPRRRACTSTSAAQFGSERNSHDLSLNAARTSVNMLAVLPGSFPIALIESAPPQSVCAVLAGCSVPPGRIIVHAAVAHVHAIDDGITKRSAALDDPPTHGSDIVIYQRSCQPMARCTASGSHAVWRVSPHLLAAFEATQMKSVRLPRRLAAHSRISYPHLSPSYAQQLFIPSQGQDFEATMQDYKEIDRYAKILSQFDHLHNDC